MSDVETEPVRGWTFRRAFAVAMIVVLVVVSIFVVVKIAKDGSTKTPSHAPTSTT